MGYTHYWRRELICPKTTFNNIVDDFEKLLPLFRVLDIPLAGGLGKGEPEITAEIVRFNGKTNCGHKENRHVVIPWPAKKIKPGVAANSDQAVVGRWFAGVTLQQRTCDGTCDYETFYFPRVLDPPKWSRPESGLYFQFTKTAFRPYDLAVQCFLVIARHHWKSLRVSSDGDALLWIEPSTIVKNALGYDDFVLDD